MAINPPPAPTGGPQTSPGRQALATSPVPDPPPLQLEPLAPYKSLQTGFSGPLQQTPVPANPTLDNPTLQGIQDKLLAIQASDPILNGSAQPHPNSVLSKHMGAGQIAGAVAQGTWQQMVAQPFHDFIDTWKRDPMTGLLETAGGLAVVGGIVGLEAITGGAATPFIFAAGAALVAPGMIQSWADEVRDPTDSNLVKALVNTSTGILSVGVPTKYFAGQTAARSLLASSLKLKKDVHTLFDSTDLMLPVRSRNEIKVGLPLQRQMEVLSMDPEALRAQMDARGITHEEPVQDLLARTQTVKDLTTRIEEAQKAGDIETASELVAALKDYAKNDLAEPRLQVASKYLFLPNNPYSHVPLVPVEGASQELYETVNKSKQVAISRINRLSHGIGLNSLRDGIPSVLERQALRKANDSVRSTANILQTHLRDLENATGVTKDEDVERVMQALEDPVEWERLAPEEKVHGQALRDIFDTMTAAELKMGTISLGLAGRMPRYTHGLTTEGATSDALHISNWLRAPIREQHRTWQAAVNLGAEGEADLEFRSQTRGEWARAPRKQQMEYESYAEYRQALQVHGDEIRKARRAVNRIKDPQKRRTYLAKFFAAHGDVARSLVVDEKGNLTPLKLLKKAESIKPATVERVLGKDALNIAIGAHVNRMHMGVIRQDLMSMANMSSLKGAFGKLAESHYGVAMHLPEFAGKFEKPMIMPENFFIGDGRSSPGANANGLGYMLVHPAIGTPKDFHYQPALYALDDAPVGKDGKKGLSLAQAIIKAGDNSERADDYQHSLWQTMNGVVSTSKRFIMGSPAWHAMNVGGRAIGFLLNDPAVAGTALKVVHSLHADPEAYAVIDEEFGLAGGRRANDFNVGEHLRRLQKEQDGQHSWPGVIRNFERPVEHAYADIIEGGFWKSVHDLQLAAYMYGKQTLRDRLGATHSEDEIQRLAAQYANNIGGMVNPLYMSKLYSHVKNLIWFAPSYWATYMHAVMSVFPGAARLSQLTAEKAGGKGVRFGAVPLRAIDQRGRKELVRMNRDWFLTYMMSGIAAADIMNVIGGGQHLWDNEQGRMFDIKVDKLGQMPGPLGGAARFAGATDQVSKTGEVKAGYVSGIPFFRQMADTANAMGLGHDWGFAHNFSDENWKKQDAVHKGLMMTGGLMDGIRRQAATKTGAPLQVGYAELMGEDFSGRIGKGVNQKVDRLAALANFVPGGYAVQQALTDQMPGNKPKQSLGQDVQSVGGALVSQFTGIPSIYHMGREKPAMDDTLFQRWQDERNSLHEQVSGASKALFAGSIQPVQYQRQKAQAMDRMDELNKTIFGPNSPAASLASQRHRLAEAYGLNNHALPDSEWFARYDAYQTAWQQQLQSASPEIRALWWENDTAQWTDADYLHWEAKQLRDSLAATIDGQGGNYIRAFQNRLAQSRPLMSPAEIKAYEEADPYYSTYKTLLSAMGQTSALGAFVSAFSSPFTNTYVSPPGLSQEEAQAMSEVSGKTVVRPETAKVLAEKAKGIAHQAQVGQAGGDANASPDFQQESQADVAAAGNA